MSDTASWANERGLLDSTAKSEDIIRRANEILTPAGKKAHTQTVEETTALLDRVIAQSGYGLVGTDEEMVDLIRTLYLIKKFMKEQYAEEVLDEKIKTLTEDLLHPTF